jgi:lysophospholipase L1-like esterase
MKAAGVLIAAFAAMASAQNADNHAYLALGDSVAFGMNVTLVPPYAKPNPQPTPSQFIGYPEALATVEGWDASQLVDASCPGETSGSFLNSLLPDNGCNSVHVVLPPLGKILLPVIDPPFKTTYGLHTRYNGAQMQFALDQFKTNKKINLVSLSIGANDVLLVLPAIELCGGVSLCVNTVLTPVLSLYAVNLRAILTKIHENYQGTLVLLTYYSPDPSLDAIAQALNKVMVQVGSQFPQAVIADGYAAFHAASAAYGDSACQAGLLIKLPASPYNSFPCDIHPSALGRVLLAATVEDALAH